MHNLRNKLVGKYNFDFKNFDFYITIAYLPLTCNLVENNKSSYRSDNIKYFFTGSIKALLDEFTLGFTSVFCKTYREIKENLESLQDSEILSKLETIADKDPNRFFNELKASFINDYNQNMKNIDKPMTILIDTFEDFPKSETIYLSSYNSPYLYGNGLWHSLDKTIWIVSGRDKLNLTSDDSWSNEYTSFFEVTNFNKHDIRQYLINRNLSTEISNLFFENTNEGDPLLSFLLSEQLLENNNQIELILSDTEKEKYRKGFLVTRYLKYIEGEDNKETNYSLGSRIQMLIALGSWSKNELYKFPKEIERRLWQSSNSEDMDSFLKRSIVTKYYEEDGSEYFSIQKNIKEIFLAEKHPRYGQQLIDIFTKQNAIEYLTTKFSENQPMKKKDIIQIIELVKTFENLNPEEKWEKLIGVHGHFKKYLNYLKEKDKKIDLINFYLIIFSEFNLVYLSKNTILASLTTIISILNFKHLKYYYNDIISLLLSLPEDVQNSEEVATLLYELGAFSKAKELFSNLFEQDSLSFDGLIIFNTLAFTDDNHKLIGDIICKLEKYKNKSISPVDNIKIDLSYFKLFINKRLFLEAHSMLNYLKEKVSLQKDFNLILEYHALLAIYYSSISNYVLAIKTNSYCIELINNCDYPAAYLPYLSDIYNNLAVNYKNIGHFGEFLHFTKKSLDIRKTYFPPNDIRVLQSENNFALALLELGEVNSALDKFKNVLEYNSKHFRNNHIKIAKNNYNIGLCYFTLEKYEEALSYFKSSYDIKKKYYCNDTDNDVLKTYTKILVCSSHLLDMADYQDLVSKIEYSITCIKTDTNIKITDEIKDCINNLIEFLLNRYLLKIISVGRKQNQLILKNIYTKSFEKTVSILTGYEYCNMEDFKDMENFKNDKLREVDIEVLELFDDKTLDYKEKILYYFDSGKMGAINYIVNNHVVNKKNRDYFINIFSSLNSELLYLKLLNLSFEEYYGKID